ncbi:MAG TPA: glycoside hydrolase family 125 protein [Candidatus Baltobacteraceae bacterium]
MHKVLAAVALLALALAPAAPARAQIVSIPMTGQRARPVQAESLFHTLFTDFFSERDGTTYVQTGDIPAMWLRDSSAQTIPYVRFAPYYPILSLRVDEVIQREAQNMLTDPYANAFQASYHVWERKWEVDSLAWPVLLTWTYWHETHDRHVFTPKLHDALRTVVKTYRCEQQHERCSRYRYIYHVSTHYAYNGNTGMIWDGFRPSDDAVSYRFNIPQEAIAVVALEEIANMSRAGWHDRKLSGEARTLAGDVETGIERYGRIFDKARGGWIYVYETDGLGHDTFMDDANIPNLTSLPALGWCANDDPAYLNTRAFALSKNNPYYFKGRYAEGLGSPHTPDGFVWPLGIIARALTATSAAEVDESITTLAVTDSKDGLIHESFYPDGYWRFTRAEFGWANAFFAELIFRSVAGFRAIPFAPRGTILPFQRTNETPRLTRPLLQLRNSALLVRTLGDMLERAKGGTTLP